MSVKNAVVLRDHEIKLLNRICFSSYWLVRFGTNSFGLVDELKQWHEFLVSRHMFTNIEWTLRSAAACLCLGFSPIAYGCIYKVFVWD